MQPHSSVVLKVTRPLLTAGFILLKDVGKATIFRPECAMWIKTEASLSSVYHLTLGVLAFGDMPFINMSSLHLHDSIPLKHIFLYTWIHANNLKTFLFFLGCKLLIYCDVSLWYHLVLHLVWPSCSASSSHTGSMRHTFCHISNIFNQHLSVKMSPQTPVLVTGL